MILNKTFIALAAAIAVALSPLANLTAAPFGSSGLSQQRSDLVQSVQTKKAKGKKKKSKKVKKGKGKKAAAATKSCGTFKYRKGGKCLDARDKKK
jgi:hypothetical protein